MSYFLQLWSNAKKSNLNKMRTFQNLALRKLLNVPSYVSNHTIHFDLKIPYVYEKAKSYYKRYHLHISSHPILLFEIFLVTLLDD